MDKKGAIRIWYGIAIAFFWTGIFTDKTYIFSPIGCCFLIAGNIRSRDFIRWKYKGLVIMENDILDIISEYNPYSNPYISPCEVCRAIVNAVKKN
jgi:hypothetical protein